jgi:DNA-binding XRE family transcriptional regulator
MVAILAHLNKSKISHHTFAKMCDVSLYTIKKIDGNDYSLSLETLLSICNKIGYDFKIDLVGEAKKVNPVVASRNKMM